MEASGSRRVLHEVFPVEWSEALEELLTDQILKRAMAAGEDFGRSRGTWVIDGNTDSEYCLRVLYGYYDGDPEIMDMMPAALSGEWAEASIPELSSKYDLNLENDDEAHEFEAGYSVGYWDEVISAAKLNVPLPIDISVPEGMGDFFMGQVNACFESHYEDEKQMAFAALVEAVRTYANMIGDKPWFVCDVLRENVEPN